ncbi:MAG: hypothetical protein L7U78_05525, partial [Schleiferiaceae bacterium]|nr:hypothetical protein [Schleiferiaceae bacterium]
MRRIGLLVALLFSLGLHAQKAVKFSEIELFQEEFLDIVDLKKEQKALFKDSLLPNAVLAADEYGELWIDLSNQMIRKRLVQSEVWEELIRLIYGTYEGEADGNSKQMVEHLLNYSKKNSSKNLKDYIHLNYLNYNKHIFNDERKLLWSAPNALWNLGFNDGSPVYSFDSEDIFGLYREDTTEIFGATFKYYPEQNEIKGSGGTVFWTRFNIPADERYAILTSWNIDITKAGYKAKAILYAPALY